MIKKYELPEWKVHEIANCRKGVWRSAFMLNSVLTKQEIASLWYISMTDYYLKVCETIYSQCTKDVNNADPSNYCKTNTDMIP